MQTLDSIFAMAIQLPSPVTNPITGYFTAMTKLSLASALLIFSSLCGFAEPISVKDKQGRAMEIELISISNDRVKFTRVSDSKTFEVPLSSFDADSTARIQAKKSALGEAHPTYEIDVVVDKRRKKKGDSYYMVEQTIAAKVSIKNPAANAPAPAGKARMLYFGEEQRTGGKYSVLSTEDYDFQLAGGATHTREIAPYVTTYDSDNKGYGNIGGQQYESYLLLIMDEKGNVIQFRTTSGRLNQLLTEKPELKAKFKTLKAKTQLDDKFVPTS